MEGERHKCDALFFVLQWWTPEECALSRAAFPTTAVRARSPSLPSHSGCVQRIEVQRTWRSQLAKLSCWSTRNESDAHGVLSLRSSRSGTSWSMRCEATHIAEPASEAVRETDMDCDHSACAMLIVFCSKLGEWCNLKEVRSDARCANKVNFPKLDLGRQTFHHLPELSSDDDVGGLGTVRSWVKCDAHKGFPVGNSGAAYN